MPKISSILVGTGQGCSTAGYVNAPKKLPTMDASDILRIQKLRVLARTTSVSSVKTTTLNGGGYGDLIQIQFANRVIVPLCSQQN
jgi:hypothetical protein